ncbi:Uncharacterised protein [Mycolicibacterium phlei]|nr:Uncharacterised protein [Mycolicibacterium phlei]
MSGALVAALTAPLREMAALVGPGGADDVAADLTAVRTALDELAAATGRGWWRTADAWTGAGADAAAAAVSATVAAGGRRRAVALLARSADAAGAAVARPTGGCATSSRGSRRAPGPWSPTWTPPRWSTRWSTTPAGRWPKPSRWSTTCAPNSTATPQPSPPLSPRRPLRRPPHRRASRPAAGCRARWARPPPVCRPPAGSGRWCARSPKRRGRRPRRRRPSATAWRCDCPTAAW